MNIYSDWLDLPDRAEFPEGSAPLQPVERRQAGQDRQGRTGDWTKVRIDIFLFLSLCICLSQSSSFILCFSLSRSLSFFSFCLIYPFISIIVSISPSLSLSLCPCLYNSVSICVCKWDTLLKKSLSLISLSLSMAMSNCYNGYMVNNNNRVTEELSRLLCTYIPNCGQDNLTFLLWPCFFCLNLFVSLCLFLSLKLHVCLGWQRSCVNSLA